MDPGWLITLKPYLAHYVLHMHIEDQQRIEAITPYFEHYKIQDIIQLVKNHLLEIRICQQIKHLNQIHYTNNCNVVFTDTFKQLYFDDKKRITIDILLNFMDSCNNIKNKFKESICSKGSVTFEISSNSLSLCVYTLTFKYTERITF